MFSENLKAYRKAKGLTQEELAVRLHVVRQSPNGRRACPSPTRTCWSAWRKVLEVSVSPLLGAGVPRRPLPTRSPNSWPGSMSSWPSKTAGPNGSGSAWPGC